MGAWIEMDIETYLNYTGFVAPLMGAWIEMRL